MAITIFKFIMAYYFVTTIFLIILLFDDRITLMRLDLKTKQPIPCSDLFVIIFAFSWILTLPMIIFKNKE